ncbi:potassium channel family protein [Haloplanus aerogenes]|uniref:Trk K+ transport system NAD-binding subunit n=1 Tax=Haloplanus aerogenes TaxID=660522 RepID=A0A3M0EA60_9EURY|nr:NAD-binding protein [Haloplanus aerogenes]AZH25368.1 TrkA family potassium uptake protein [Haloplanus aerogenes]RMB25070.1 Trk K+ transport system NAD-binding subunit [Haloplanus aerogenes]
MRTYELVDRLPPKRFTRRQRLLLVYAVGLITIILTYTLLYNAGMRYFEGDQQSVFHSAQIVVETMTTTGYGSDSPWSTPVMNTMMITMQVTGVVIGFVTLRVLVIPLFERTPLNLDDRLSAKNDHVVLAEYQRNTEVVLDELEELGVQYVLLESEEDEAKRLSDDGYQTIHGDPEDRDDLNRATIERAKLLITDAGDRTASIVLTALEANEELNVVSFTASTRRKAALKEVGVDRSVAPHALIGQQLAEKATTPIAIEANVENDAIGVREILVRHDSPLHGVRIDESPVPEHPNLTLVAGWFDGELRLSPAPEDRLTSNTVLLVAGPVSEITALAREIAGLREPGDTAHSNVIIAGLGEGGSAAAERLTADTAVTTIDDDPDTNPDIVGDTTEPETLRAAGIEEATALLVTVDDDSSALMTVAMARSLSAEVELLVRITDAEKTSAAVRAGADYTLSVQRVCARLVAAEIHGERVISPVNQIRLVRASGASFAGEQLAAIRQDPNRDWTVVGVARAGEVLTDESTWVRPEDEVFVAGSDDAIQKFERTADLS